ncbi:MAG: hypothetical protein J6S23_02040 [Clostridia bacterium]|nr:hypothetical protein [Clostridia bacterium]
MTISAPENKDLKLFYAKLDDLEKRTLSGAVSHSAFLTPSEAYKAEKYFEAKGNKDKICFFGGYFAAQRKQIFLLPEYIVDCADGSDIFEMIDEDLNDAICTLKISGSGFRELTHRDYLGSILSLGLERETLGDICILDNHSAIVFCNAEVSNFILFELSAIGNDKVKVEKITVDKNMASTQKYQGFTDTVASERLDCVVAAIFNLSREKAQNLINGGFVEFNYETATKVDVKVEAMDIISARGFGKFIIRDLSQSTKKGRLRLFADKYI